MDDKTDDTVCSDGERDSQSLSGAGLWEIFSCATDAVFAVNDACHIVYQNRTFAEFFSHGNSAPPRRKCYEVVCGRNPEGKDFCCSDCPLGKSLLEGRPVENFDLQVRRGNGKMILMNVGAMPVSRTLDNVAAIFMLRPIDPSCSLFHSVDDRKRTNGNFPDIEHRLTCRERQILKLLAEGLDTKALANALHISHVTARNHVQHIYAKLGVHNRAEAVSYVFRHGLMR